MVSKRIMAFYGFVDLWLLAAGLLSLIMSLVWRAPNLMLNFTLSNSDLTGKSPVFCRIVPHLIPETSWHGAWYHAVDHIRHLHLRRCAAEPCYRGPRLPQLDTHRRRNRHPRHRNLHLVLLSEAAQQLLRGVPSVKSHCASTDSGQGTLPLEIRASARISATFDLLASSHRVFVGYL